MNPTGFLLFLTFLSLVTTSYGDLVRTRGAHEFNYGCAKIEGIYSFGDSISDTGNLIREGTGPSFAAISKFPYGINAFDKPTGRCSDGFLMIDYFAMGLGLPLLSPYLDKQANFSNGVNFAVAGATALDKSFFVGKGIVLPFTNSSLDVQLKWYDDHVNSTCAHNISECKEKVKRSMFFVEIGGNDFNYALFGGTPVEVVKSFVPNVVDKIIETSKKLIERGTTFLVVPGNFPIGCMPSYLTAFRTTNVSSYDGYRCLKPLNEFARYYNYRLAGALADLSLNNSKITIHYLDYYRSFLNIFKKSGFLGFEQKSWLTVCCGSGGGPYNFNMTASCGANGTTTCRWPSRRLSWDGVHLTGEAYKIMTEELVFGGTGIIKNRLWKNWLCSGK